MVAELTYEPGVARGSGAMIRLARYRVDDTTYLIQTLDEWQPEQRHEADFLGYEVAGRRHAFMHIPDEDDAFAWVARQQHYFDETRRVFILIGSERQQVRVDQLREIDTAKMVGPVWCPVANMTAQRPYGPGGAEIKRGSKHFAVGAKLYYRSGFWGNGAEQVEMVGHHRASHRYVTMVVSSAWLENWRVELAYSPHIIREMWPSWSGTARSKQEAQDIVDIMRRRVIENGSPAG